MLQKPNECVGCALHTIGQGFSRPEGTGINRVLLCGEALGYHEAYDGLPFRPRAEAGHVLEMAIQGIGCTRNQFSLFNICACQPLNNVLDGASYEISAINHCKVHFKRVMEQFRPRVIVALGAIPTRTLTGLTGKKLTVEMLQGFPIPAIDYPGVWVIPCYHPSYINRGAWQCLPILMRCLKKAVKIAQLEQYIPEKVNYTTNGTNYELDLLAEELEAKSELVLIGDIETLGKEIDVTLDDEEEDESEDKEAKGITLFQDITQWNFSIKKGEAVAVVNSPDYHAAIRRLWATQNTKAGHNFWFFDLLVMLYNGFKVSGTIHDTLFMFHWMYPDLPGRKGQITDQTDNDKKDAGSLASLQFCASNYDYPWPWKHEFNSNPGWYGCCDGDSNLRVYYACKYEMEQLGVWQGYIDGVYKMCPILQKMADRGIPVNRAKMMAFVKRLEQMAETVFSRALPLVPKELWPTKQKQGLKKAPKDTNGYIQKTFFIPEEQAERCTCARVMRHEPVPVLGGGFGDNVKQLGEKWYKVKWNCPQCKGTGRLFGEVTRWAFEEEPKIGSPYLLKAYAKYKMHRVPLNKKRKYAMDKEVLDKLIKKYNDPLYQLTREHRELTKMRSTYAVGWMPSEIDECVHPHFGFAPANGQFNCVAGWTLVTTKRGVIPINLVNVGDSVWTHRNRWRKVIGVWSKSAEPMFDVKFNTGAVLTCTTNHKLLEVLANEHFSSVDKEQEERNRSFETLSLTRIPNYSIYSKAARGNYSHDKFYSTHQDAAQRIQSLAKDSILTLENWEQEPDVREDWKIKSDLERRDRRWVRLSDVIRRWRETVCSSESNGQGSRFEETARDILCTSYQRRQERQQSGQPSPSNEQGSFANTQVATRAGYCLIQEIYGVGSHKVYDISVDEDESYEACGVFCHNSKGPNAQNVTSIEKFAARTAIKEVNLAEEFRDCIEAKPGHVLISFDWKSMHSQTIAHQAQDWDYLRLAKLDAHSYLTAWIVGLAEKDKALAWDNEKLRAWLKDIKKKYLAVREGEAKPAMHGWQFGLGASTLYSFNVYDPEKRTGFRDVKESQKVLDALDAAFPVTAEFRRQVPLIAKRQKYLKNLYHAIRWFWCIERWNVDAKKWVHGLDWDKAISFYPQFNAFGYKKFCYSRLEENYQEGSLLDKYGLCNDLHDSLFFHCRAELADECLEMVRLEMERPSEVLLLPESVHERFGKGLSIEVEAKMSKTSWREMETIS